MFTFIHFAHFLKGTVSKQCKDAKSADSQEDRNDWKMNNYWKILF